MSCTITIVLSGQGHVDQRVIAARCEHDAVSEGYTAERVEINGQVISTAGITIPMPTLVEMRDRIKRAWPSSSVREDKLVDIIAIEIGAYLVSLIARTQDGVRSQRRSAEGATAARERSFRNEDGSHNLPLPRE